MSELSNLATQLTALGSELKTVADILDRGPTPTPPVDDVPSSIDGGTLDTQPGGSVLDGGTV